MKNNISIITCALFWHNRVVILQKKDKIMNVKIPIFTIALLLCFSCSKSKPKQVKINVDTATAFSQSETLVSQEMTLKNVEAAIDSFAKYNKNKSLNEIRFGNWTDKEWYDNDYFRFLRKCFDDCLKGVKNKNTLQLNNYKSALNDKFIIYNAEPSIVGGMFITLGFFNKPEIQYQTNVYSVANRRTKKITNYSLRGFKKLDEKADITKEEILQIIKEHPENKLW